MSMSIPPKITDMIIKSVEDHVTLRACALVCRGWLPASRHQLFRRITIMSEPSFEGTYQSLVKHVLRSRNLWQYLHSVLEVMITDVPSSSEEKPRRPYRLFFCEFAGQMPNLQRFYFHRCTWNHSLPAPGERLFLYGFPSVTSLELVDCRFPSVSFLRHMLMSLPRLRRLRFFMVKVASPSQSTSLSSLSPASQKESLPALEFLALCCCHDDTFLDPFLTWLSRTRTRCSIREFVYSIPFCWSPPDKRILRQGHVDFLQAIGPSVHHMTSFPAENFPYSHLRILHSLTMILTRDWAEICLILRALSCPIRSLIIYDIFSRDALLQSQCDWQQPPRPCIEDDGLEEVDSILSKELFKDLKKVTIFFVLTEAQKQNQEAELLVIFQCRLRRLHARLGKRLNILYNAIPPSVAAPSTPTLFPIVPPIQ
ncbi:hypothetical protein C8Q74DRAFT_478443 [Fomes fomentarius]|nr:hypothetical protein C8Q74DRAFT_478443 [Fomes fomentarius]